MPTLKRIRDGAGCSGSQAQSIKWKEDGTFDKIVDSKPVVGCSFLVGRATASSYGNGDDYWLTTVVTKIIKECRDSDNKLEYVKFKTENSSYECFT
jgi:hypothetical protein